jgi:hypothetical protein
VLIAFLSVLILFQAAFDVALLRQTFRGLQLQTDDMLLGTFLQALRLSLASITLSWPCPALPRCFPLRIRF